MFKIIIIINQFAFPSKISNVRCFHPKYKIGVFGYPISFWVSNLISYTQFEIGYLIRLDIYQSYLVNPKNVFEKCFIDTQTSSSHLTILFSLKSNETKRVF